jgi:anti-anti-sigma factor
MLDNAFTPSGQITVEQHGDVRVVSFRGEHDLGSADLARDLLDDARQHGDVVIVDLTATLLIDSTIVSVLFSAHQADSPPKVRFVVARGSQPEKVLTTTRLDTVMPVYERLEDALGATRSSGSRRVEWPQPDAC